MKRFMDVKKTIFSAASVCLMMGMLLCIVGCGAKKTGTVYRYEGSTYTETYILYDDGTYKREYKGPHLGVEDADITLETGTYETYYSSSVTFAVEKVTDSWPSGPYKAWILSSSYYGSLTGDYLSVYGTRYKERGTMTSSK